MPIYNYQCLRCGLCFEKFQAIVHRDNAFCPDCSSSGRLIPSIPARILVQQSDRLPLGNKSRGRFLTSEETGGLPILIPSWGALEKEEIDYVAEAAIEGEKERVKNTPVREATLALRSVVKETLKAPEGKRKKTLDKISKDGLR